MSKKKGDKSQSQELAAPIFAMNRAPARQAMLAQRCANCRLP